MAIGWIIAIIIWIGCGCLCEYLGNLKGQKGCFLYGFLLGFIGIIIVLCLKDKSNEVNVGNNSNYVSSNKYDDLKKLQELRTSGTITDEEFEKEKSKILSK